jgi:sphingosine kinase
MINRFYMILSFIKTRASVLIEFLFNLFKKTQIFEYSSMSINNDRVDTSPLLSDEFNYENNGEKVQAYLFNDLIKAVNYRTNKPCFYYMRDMAGCSVAKSQKQNDLKAYLTIYMYPRVKINDLKRKRDVVIFEYSSKDSYQKNVDVVNIWAEKIRRILSRDSPSKPFLVYVNPNSGSGKAESLFEERIKPVWAEACIPYMLVKTKFPKHAFEHVKEVNLAEIRGIFVVSGDGLVYEILNGLMDREDWREAIKIPIGQLPGGSANALSVIICYLAKEAYLGLSSEAYAMHMGFISSKYKIAPMDLVAIDTTPEKEKRGLVVNNRVYSFLSVEWAILADIDFESEKYRFLGGFRFLFVALNRILNLKSYPGRLSFLPSDTFTPKTKSFNIIQHPKVKNNAENYENSRSSKLDSRYLAPLNKPVPDDWMIIEDKFVFFLAVQKPLIAKDFISWPESSLDNNEILLIFIKAGITKLQAIKIFLETETGEYLNNELVESVRVKAFRIEPFEENSYLMVDGESVPYGPLQAEVMEEKLNCIAK